jgi:hypothetical protein
LGAVPAAFGNSTGDQQMLEYTKAGDGARLSMIVLHDDAEREYAYGHGLPDTKVGTCPGTLRRGEEGWLEHQHEERLSVSSPSHKIISPNPSSPNGGKGRGCAERIKHLSLPHQQIRRSV